MREKIRSWISGHEEEFIKDLARLVKYRSVSVRREGNHPYGDECAAAVDELISMGKEYGFEAENAEYYCANISYNKGGKSIGLWGHLDVVPDNGEWIYPPYGLTRKGDMLIGRGVSDDKGPTILCLYAMRCIKELGIPINSAIELIAGCAEETGMDDIEYYAKNYKMPDYNIVADADFPVSYAEKGIADIEVISPALSPAVIDIRAGTVTNIVPDYAEIILSPKSTDGAALSRLTDEYAVKRNADSIVISANGIAKHSAYPDGSVNAIGKLLRAIIDAGILCENDSKALGIIADICNNPNGSVIGIKNDDAETGPLTGVGSVIKMKDRKAALNINIRYPVPVKTEWLIGQITVSAEKNGCECALISDSRPCHVDKDSFFVRALTDVYADITGQREEPIFMCGGTYARKLPNAVSFGPFMPFDFSELRLPEGHGGHHCPDECHPLSAFMKALEIYILSLIELDKLI